MTEAVGRRKLAGAPTEAHLPSFLAAFSFFLACFSFVLSLGLFDFAGFS